MSKMIVFIGFAFFSITANADCDKPKDDFDGVYCLNKIYIQADKDLNDSYVALTGKLDTNGREMLRVAQVRWIEQRNAKCSLRNERGFFVNLRCATTTTIERTKFLQDRYRECISSGCLKSKL